MWLFFIFVVVPVIEVALFIKLGGWLGTFPTLAIIVITAALGTFLVKTQAILTFNAIKSKFRNLRNPTEPLADAGMIVFAGALLLTPGFFTDTFGFLLLMPWFRAYILRFFKRKIDFQNIGLSDTGDNTHYTYSKKSRDHTVIEGEYWENESNAAKDAKK